MNKKATTIVLMNKNQQGKPDPIRIKKIQTETCYLVCQEKSTSGGKKVHL